MSRRILNLTKVRVNSSKVRVNENSLIRLRFLASTDRIKANFHFAPVWLIKLIRLNRYTPVSPIETPSVTNLFISINLIRGPFSLSKVRLTPSSGNKGVFP